MSYSMSLLRRLFLTREIKSKEGKLHFQRWRLLQTPWFAVYIHRIFKHDEDKHCHDHPWSFVSVILSGGYAVGVPNTLGRRVYFAPDASYNKSTSFHKLARLYRVPTTTLVFTGPRNREWGYSVDGEWVHNKEYRMRKRAGHYGC